ncbi:MAG: glutamate 5-kinase [Desulfuromonadales bacterium]|nr:glutamate 5-kinase [Desulfuromonadales bacterium]
MRSELLKHVKRIVIKIGSGVISDDKGLNIERMTGICADVDQLRRRGYEIIIVSSGAVAAGKADLGIVGRPETIPLKQAAAAIGQSRLMRTFKDALRGHGYTVGQILLTRDDLANRRRFLNARNTLMTLIDFGVIPIINENDSVVVDEIRFGDNDNLSAMTTNLAEAHLLVIMSDVNGLYDRNPHLHKDATLIPLVERVDEKVKAIAGDSVTDVGTGGMASKVKAAERATLYGVGVAFLNGFTPGILSQLMDGEEVGTYFLPARNRMNARKHWIAFTKKPRGKLRLDAGAHKALVERGKSLLPSGVATMEGVFERGDAIRLCDLDGTEFARGVTNYSSAELERIKGKKSSEIEAILGYKYNDEIVHRNNMVLNN